MTKIDTQRLRELLEKALEDVQCSASGSVMYPSDRAGQSVMFLAKHGPALIARIAELEERVATMESVQSDALERATDRIIAGGDAGLRARLAKLEAERDAVMAAPEARIEWQQHVGMVLGSCRLSSDIIGKRVRLVPVAEVG